MRMMKNYNNIFYNSKLKVYVTGKRLQTKIAGVKMNNCNQM